MVPKLCKTFSGPSYRLNEVLLSNGLGERKGSEEKWFCDLKLEAWDPEEVIILCIFSADTCLGPAPSRGLKPLADSGSPLEDFKNTASWCLKNPGHVV